ncbi:MAG TPA: AmmeMemoRadiSam system protein A [Gammaproteobacteria bacterium]|nr:AmmeMemoRadiSam system protein A [Gammaproteobacteria bacterium]
MLDDDERGTLLHVARTSIEQALRGGKSGLDETTLSAGLAETRASFVTLKRQNSALRGCIGTLEARRRLVDDVAYNARAAALHDPRFAPLTQDELADLRIEISVLTAPQPLAVWSHAELLLQLRPGSDGLIVADGARRATFLPSVWETLPQARDFVSALWQKAGIEPETWPPALRVWRYEAEHFTERPPTASS